MDIRRAALAAAALALLVPGTALAQDTPEDEPGVSEERAVKIAERDPNAIEAKREHPDVFPSANQSDSDRDWEVGFFADDEQIVQVVVDDQSGEVEESWTGHQVAWRMARGYEGAFGRKLNAPYVWLPLCAIFILGLFDWRRPLRIAHLDLLVLTAGFGVSHFFFNQGDIGLSVPLAYPALLYLLARTLWLAFRGGDGLRPSLPVTWLAIAAVALIGFRIGLNVADSNVIDVGYSGVIGADKIADGEPLYDDFPEDNRHGDTYGPVAYYAYFPFEQAFPWSGDWDDLPAAHGAAIFFDLGTIAALFLLGRRLRPGDGSRLGVLLAFAWAACPYTAFALESNTNDALVSLLLVCALLFLMSPPVRGGILALASLTKFVPLALAPLFATYDETRNAAVAWPPRQALRAVGPFALAFLLVTAAVSAQALIDPGPSTFWERTIGNQAGRESPFSVWGQADLEWLHTALKVATVALVLAVAVFPRRRGPVTIAALGAAVLLALQLAVEHWFYLYIPWFAGFLFVALLASDRDQGPRRTITGSIDRARPSSPMSTAAPITQTFSVAVSNRTGICVRNPSSACSRLTPMMPSREPVIPTSVMCAVPPGRTRASAVGTWVCVPRTAAALPSRCHPIATFSLVSSAWKSTKIASARPSSSPRSSSMTGKGERSTRMWSRPLRLTTATRIPAASTIVWPRPGLPSGKLAGRTIRASDWR